MKLIKQLHKWVSLFVGLQFMLWLISGVYFNFMDHHKAAGSTYLADAPAPATFSSLVPLPVMQGVEEVRLVQLLEKPYYLLVKQRPLYAYWLGHYELVDALTGTPHQVDSVMAEQLARASYSGPGLLADVSLLQPPIADLPKERNAMWRVAFDDDIQTAVYVRQQSGEIAGHVDTHRRLRDVFFTLHFMDYASEGSFNNIQIMIMAVLSLWLAVTGVIWIVALVKDGQYRPAFGDQVHALQLTNAQGVSAGRLEMDANVNLYDGLAKAGQLLPSSCGGGGTCGLCKVQCLDAPTFTSADAEVLTEQELAQGWRLACQHQVKDFTDICLPETCTKVDKHELQLTAARFVTGNIKELTFRSLAGVPLAYQAGAYMRFDIPAGSQPSVQPEQLSLAEDNPCFERQACQRNYSLAAPEGERELVFNVRLHCAPSQQVPPGMGSNYLCHLQPGDKVTAFGPFSEFKLIEGSQKPVVLLGAGSGMAPLRAILLELLRRDDADRPLYFFYGARAEGDLLYYDEMMRLSSLHSRLSYYPVLSQPSEQWTGATGYVQDTLMLNQQLLGELKEMEYYLCGPVEMMQQTIAMLKAAGVADEAIRFDSFGQLPSLVTGNDEVKR
ncbi:2Fe-2S iron-sulfur cluster binding domain-containing protein [Bowmanella sp. Y26]|uniref:2Fe-2S iron-sulfur cluster-binding protein n=1 Tax=Bowmanella yangjiangensis TaxID=2811230 RepID=UPI001BDC89EF|nr:2Fe-2S iron-sulfur cluster-binding protein [Bowmanella yangjiangensis]MBT1063312.1 2Fe-2S iron-sulfur cluster binding domain-containing protein [Bowmanella yangjiangensis]